MEGFAEDQCVAPRLETESRGGPAGDTAINKPPRLLGSRWAEPVVTSWPGQQDPCTPTGSGTPHPSPPVSAPQSPLDCQEKPGVESHPLLHTQASGEVPLRCPRAADAATRTTRPKHKHSSSRG